MVTRREILILSAAPLVQAANGKGIRLGGPVFVKTDDPVELAREHKRLGYSAAYCPAAKSDDSARIKAIREAFAAEDVVISEVGAWKNMLDPDAAKRKANLDYVTERLQLAEAVGARCCVDIAGSFSPDRWEGPHPDNLSQRFLDATVENCRTVIDAVKPRNTKFSIEMMPWSLPDGPDAYLRLIKAVDRPAFGVHMDVCNVMNSPTRFYRNAEIINECFQKLGKWTLSCHAKDLAWIPAVSVQIKEVIPGRGLLSYQAYLTALARYAPDAPLMLEHLSKAEEYDEGAHYIRGEAQKAGVAIR